MSEAKIEAQLQAKGLDAPRLTPTDIAGVIKKASYYVFPGTTTTVCRLELVNGFGVIGTSAAASLENFDEEIGREIACANARKEIWQLEGYLLKQKLFEGML